MGLILSRLSRSSALVGLVFLCFIAAAGTCSAQPRLGVYFDFQQHYRPQGPYEIFEAQLILYGTDTYVSGVEYSLATPYDPTHATLVILGIEYNDNFSLDIGFPFSGHSMTFWPPLDGSADYNILCTYTFLTLQGCDNGMITDWPIVVSPHPDSGFLRGTSYPGHELFDIIGDMSYLCPSHWPPMLTDVQVYSPRSVRAWFNQCVYNWEWSYNSIFTAYTAAAPHDTIDVLLATKHRSEYDDGAEFFVYFKDPLQPGVEYTLEASACCECNGCATSTRQFVYDGSAGDLPDIAVTFWSNHEQYVSQPYDCSTIEIPYIVRNLGIAGSGPFLNRITVGPRNGGASVTVWTDSCSGLPIDGILQGTATVLLPYVPTWLGDLTFEADYEGWITEYNEEDNHKDIGVGSYRPEIISIEDVPEDCGRQVELKFNGSLYSLQFPAEDDEYRILRLNPSTDEWEEVLSFDEAGDTVYTCTVPTVVDSSGGGESYWTTFMVEYQRYSHPYSSCPDSGYSVDDLGPTAALLLTSSVETAGGSLMLKWAVMESPDFGEFSVARAEPGGTFQNIGSLPIPPGEYSFVFEDPSAEPGIKYIYQVAYTDGNGTNILFETEPAGLPRLPFALHQNRPNPFNPSTEIGFSLPEPAAVILDIYDVSGKKVRRLLDETRPAGNHSVHWDGLDSNGSQAVSGVYFYRLTAGKDAFSRKMILLR
jgi:hypothetical protein